MLCAGWFWRTARPLEAGAPGANLQAPASVPRAPIATSPSQSLGTASPESPAPPAASQPLELSKSSLRDTQVDGEVQFAADGSVRYTRSLRQLFDYYLSLTGEVAPAQLRAFVLAQLNVRYPSEVVAQLEQILDRYLACLRAFDQRMPELSALKGADRLAAMQRLRREMLGAELAEAFFAEDEAWDEFALAREALSKDRTLAPGERARALAELEAKLPEALRAGVLGERQSERVLARNSEITEQIADPAARFAAREAEFGSEVAARYALLEREQGNWDARVQAYVAARNELQARTPAAVELQTQLSALRAAQFNESERQRIEALEAIGQLPAPGQAIR